MILRRIAQHVKDQNWTAVGLDLAIVVVGVFLGIQVSNWNDARKARAEEAALVGRLLDEAGDARRALAEHRAFHAGNSEQIVALVARLEDPARCGEAETNEQKAQIFGVGDFPPPRFALTTAAEAAESGRLALLQSEALQTAVREVVVEMAFVTEQWRRYVPVKRAAEQVYLDAGLVQTAPLEWDQDNRGFYRDVTGDLEFRTPERLCNRPDLAALASNAALTQAFYVAYLDQVADRLDAYSGLLADHAERRGGRRDSPPREP
ncbi:hypothetical protein [Rubrivirga sp. IMCC45206]|uniref:hypothetical protein n=1 Tax=Rubrivirga sp. IMCC45206 TaxID=3391614 RepID=UPI00398FEE8A